MGKEQNNLSNSGKNFSVEKKSDKKVKTEGLFNLIGGDTKELEKEMGEPDRVDLSAYGYDWWIYKLSKTKYVQVGVDNKKVVTIFATGKDINIKPFYIGQPIGEIYSSYFIESILDFYYDNQTYHFELSEEDINFRPIIRINSMYVQLYIDKFSGTISSIRIMDVPTLIELRPFDYREVGWENSHASQVDDEALAKVYEMQIQDITNMIRRRFALRPLERNEDLAMEAYNKSKEMFESNLFSIDEEKEEQSERLKMGDFAYTMPDENIAVHYLDAPAVVEGWFNSEIHRKNLLNKDYTTAGVGVYKNYFTQKFAPKSVKQK